ATGGRSHGDQATGPAADRQHRPGAAVTARAGSTRLRWGGATDVGRVRSNNQDQYVARDDVGLWAVADGMGGPRGGEVAWEIACDPVARSFDRHTIDGLVDAIEQANSAVFRAGAGDPD